MKSKFLNLIKSQKLWRVLGCLAIVTALISPVLSPPDYARAADGDTYYWVGVNNGSGNWSDVNCWANVSGGAGGAFGTPPNATNNVTFDVNSINTTSAVITIDSAANCFAMDSTGVLNIPTLAGSSTLNIYGNFVIDGIIWNKTGTTALLNTSTANITTNDITIGNSSGSFQFNGTGSYQLQDDLIFGGTYNLAKSSTSIFDANGKKVIFNGTTHRITGIFTFYDLLRNGTATKTDSFVLESDIIVTNDLYLTGNSSINRLLVKPYVTGLPTSIAANNTYITNTDFQDTVGSNALKFTDNISGQGGEQGFIFDGTNYYIISTDKIERYDAGWTINATRNNAATIDCGVNHLGDGDYYDGKIYVAANDYPAAPDYNSRIGVWNSSNLSFIGYYDISSQGVDASGLCIDGIDGLIYVSRFDGDGTTLYKYNLSDFSYNGTVTFSKAIRKIQGINLYNSYFYITSYYGGSNIQKTNKTGEFFGVLSVTPNEIEGLDFVGTTLYVLIGGVNQIYEYVEESPDWDLSAIAGLSGDCGGNTGIIFTNPESQYWIPTITGGTGSWSEQTHWSTTSGGVNDGRVPLPQDDSYIDINSVSDVGKTITVDMDRIGKDIIISGVSYNPVINKSVATTNYGSYYIDSNVTYNDSGVHTFSGRESCNLTSNGKSFASIILSSPNGTLTLQDNLQTSPSNYIRISYGTFDANDKNILTGAVYSNNIGTRTIYMGNGVWTLARTAAGSKWIMLASDSTLSLYPESSTIVITNTTTNAHNFYGCGLVYNDVSVEGTGNYTLTLIGNNTYNTFSVNATTAAKTIVGTGTSQLVDDFTRDTGANIITLTGGTWSKSNTTPLWLDYLTVTGSTANTTGVWFAGQHSTDGGGNTAWIFDDPAITVETISATGITMDKDGVTGGTLTGNVTTLLDGTPRIPVHAEIGLTAAYGTNITGGMVYSSGLFTISVPVNQTPGATYHWRVVGETGNASSPFNGLDSTYVYTLPTFTTLPVSNESASGGSRATLNANVSNMGVASDSYVFFQWGYSPTALSNTGLHTVSGTGDTSSTLIGFNPTETIYYRSATTIGSVTTYGNIVSFAVSDGASNAMTILYNVGLVVIGLAICILVFILYRSAGGLVALIAAVVGILGFTIIKTFLESLW